MADSFTFNGVDMSQYGLYVEPSPRPMLAPLNTQAAQAAAQDGLIAGESTRDPLRISLNCFVDADDANDLETKLNSIANALDITTDKTLTVDAWPSQVYSARVDGGIESLQIGIDGASFRISFISLPGRPFENVPPEDLPPESLPDVQKTQTFRFTDADRITPASGGDQRFRKTVTVNVGGSQPVPFTVLWDTREANPSTPPTHAIGTWKVTKLSTGEFVERSGSGEAFSGDMWRLDTDALSVERRATNADPWVQDMAKVSGQFPKLDPGDNDLEFYTISNDTSDTGAPEASDIEDMLLTIGWYQPSAWVGSA